MPDIPQGREYIVSHARCIVKQRLTTVVRKSLRFPLHVNATVDTKRLTRDIVPVNNQVADCASYLLRSTNATERYAPENCLLHLPWNCSIHFCFYETRTNCIDGYIGASQL